MTEQPKDPSDESLATALAEGRTTARTLWEVYSDKTKRTMLVENKSLDTWAKYFFIPLIDVNGNPPPPTEAKRLSAKTGNLIQEATGMLRNIKLRADSLRESYEKEVDKAVSDLIDEWKKEHAGIKGRLPARDLFERQAKQSKAQLHNAVVHAEGIIKFFENIERSLLHVFKALDQVGTASAHELKADGYIPKVQ